MKPERLILKRLLSHSYQAYIVGGAVRDIILGITPKDIDIVTSATPEQIRPLFKDFAIIDVGKAFGIITIHKDGESFEIATFRADGHSSDSRRPDSITYVQTIEEDLARRDFTCNAIAMDINNNLIDPFNGRQDIQQKLIKFVGDPLKRISEDRLRILRAYRFMSQLDFTLHAATHKAIYKATRDPNHAFTGISQERITAEFSRTLKGKNCFNTIKLMAEDGVLFLIIPELKELITPHNNPHHPETMHPWGNTIFAHTMLVLKAMCENEPASNDIDSKLVTRLAALLHDIAKPLCRANKGDYDNFVGHDTQGEQITQKIMRRMCFSNQMIKRVANLVSMHMQIFDITKTHKVAKIRRLLGVNDIENLLSLARADKANTDGETALMNVVNKYKERYPVMLPPPLVTGDDLILAGYTPDKIFKRMLDLAYNEQLRDETATKEQLMYRVVYHVKMT